MRSRVALTGVPRRAGAVLVTRVLGAEDGVGVTGARTRLRITTGELRMKGGPHGIRSA